MVSARALASGLEPVATTGSVIGVADTADRRHQPGFGQTLGVVHGKVQGGFFRSSQYPDLGGADADRKAKIRTVHAAQIVLARTAACLAA